MSKKAGIDELILLRMKLETRFSLRQLVMISLGSSFSLLLDLLLLALFRGLKRIPDSFPEWCLAIGLILILPSGLCVWTSLAGIKAVRRGLMDNRWPPPSVEASLHLLQSKGLKWTVQGLLLAGFLVCMGGFVLQRTHHPHPTPWGLFIYFFTGPLMTRSELLKLLTPPKPSRSSTAFLSDMKPIIFAHWGERGV